MPWSRLGAVLAVVLFVSASSVSAERSGPARSVALDTDALPVLDAPPIPVAAHPSPRSGTGLDWVRVHLPGQSPCSESSASGDGQTVEHVWCFEGAGGDSSWPAGEGDWDHYPAPGAPPWDGWQLVFDPTYAGEETTCRFADDWMWSAKEEAVPSWANGFHFLLVSPSIPVTNWTAGLVEYDAFMQSNNRDDVWNIVGRAWDTGSGWSSWNDFDGGFVTIGTGFWGTKFEDFSDFLGPGTDSVQIAWELIDVSTPGSNSWGKHGGVKFFVDNVSFASWDGTETRFTARVIDVFTETFSLSDPAHTPFLQNDEQGDWIGSGGARAFAADESLTVGIHDPDGIGAGAVQLHWTTDGGGAWHSKAMSLSIPNGTVGGDYRAIIGADDGGPEDMTPAADGLVWAAGTRVDWYVEATDDDLNVCTWPAGAPGETFDFRVLPFGNTSPEQNHETYLLVEDTRAWAVDVENSEGFDPDGGLGSGNWEYPAWKRSAEMVRDALDALGLVYDRYVVGGAGSSVELEPRGYADPAKGLGGLMDELGNPNYDCIVWVGAGGFAGSFSEQSRLNLAAFLDGGGHLVVTGDGIASHLGAGGSGIDPVFLATYLGTEMASAADDATDARRLDTQGTGALAGINLGLYADCPYLRLLDRLTLASPAPGSSNAVLMEYTNGGAGDNGRSSVILNERTASGGRAALTGFDPGALVSHESRACLYGSVLGTAIGRTIPSPPACPNTGTDADVDAGLAGFRLAEAEPNPFRERTSVRLTVPRDLAVEVAVYDVAGRRVRKLVDGPLPAGTHRRVWDGRTDAGEPAAAGVYFVRMVAGEHRSTRKAVLLR